MNSVRKSKKAKCPTCGGKGLVFEIIDNGKDAFWDRTRRVANMEQELRLPNLTGNKEQCDEAIIIRTNFIHKAKKQYQAESFNTFIKLISYEAHSIFWIWNKNSSIGCLIGKIAVKNPTAFDLINSLDN
ncbi:MAG: hypothetical protein J0665_14770 [Deltaproteobacteria bacterium]|jgi:hypothetical protein|nr:hypothetical protein [Deltaproteobacteria bacterium]